MKKMFKKTFSFGRKEKKDNSEKQPEQAPEESPEKKKVFQDVKFVVMLENEMATMDFSENNLDFYLYRRHIAHKFALSDILDIDESGREQHIARLAFRPPEKFLTWLVDDNAKSLVGRNIYTFIATRSGTLLPPPPPPPSVDPIPLVLNLNFRNWTSYERFISLLIEVGIFYRNAEPPPTAAQLKMTAGSDGSAAGPSTSSGESEGNWFKNKLSNGLKKLPIEKIPKFLTERPGSSSSNDKNGNQEEPWELKLTLEQMRNLKGILYMLCDWKDSAQDYSKKSLNYFITKPQ